MKKEPVLNDKGRRQSCAAIIVAAGSGSRMGGPKQLLPLGGKPLVFHCIETFLSLPEFEEIVVVTQLPYAAAIKNNFSDHRIKTVPGGETRLESVAKGLSATGPDITLIAVHDGARPLVTAKTIRECIAKAYECGAAVAAVPVKDTIKTATPDNKLVASTPDRNSLWAAQTPQCYTTAVLKKALEGAKINKYATDESQLAEKAGVPVCLVPSEYSNLKITTPEDITIAEALMKSEKSSSKDSSMRVGIGFDVHRMVPGRPLILGGIQIPHPKGLLGHSDGDIIVHAICDAALGAVAAGEIGIYFPPSDMMIMGISSKEIAEKTLQLLKEKNAVLSQIDAVIIAEEPKLLHHYDALRSSVAEIFRLPKDRVSIKAKSNEGLGEIGKGEAMSCHAIVAVEVK